MAFFVDIKGLTAFNRKNSAVSGAELENSRVSGV